MPEKKEQTKRILFLWNDDAYADILKNRFGNENVIISWSEFEKKKLQKYIGIVILVELKWKGKMYSSVFGHEIALRLIAEGSTIPMLFCSFWVRKTIRGKTKASSLLNPIFPHEQLPFTNDVLGSLHTRFIEFHDIKWFYIRQYLAKRGSAVDIVEHALRQIQPVSSFNERHEILTKVSFYAPFLDELSQHYLNAALNALMEKDDQSIVDSNIEKLKAYLPKLKEWNEENTTRSPRRSSHKVIIVEDNETIRNELETGLSPYFQVESFADSNVAWKELENNGSKYSAVISDMELLNAESNWQPLQGFELLVNANRFSHLALIGMTALPKSAGSTIEWRLKKYSRASLLYKGDRSPLPSGWSYEAFADILMEEIKKRHSYRNGPNKGAWKNGLLSYYYFRKENENLWKELWQDVVDRVGNFLQSENNELELIPKELFTEKTKEFDDEKLTIALTHRLLNLHYQFKKGYVVFADIKELIGFKKTQHKQYFNSTLGFSVRKKDTRSDAVCIQKSSLLDEELQWLKNCEDLKENETLQFSGLVNAIAEAIEYVSKAKKGNDFPSSINSLKECQGALEKLVDLKISSSLRNDLKETISSYQREYKEEIQRLGQNKAGKVIVRILDEFLKDDEI